MHGAHIHRRDSDLVEAVAEYLTEGFAAGGAGVVVATPEHRAALRSALCARGLGTALGGGRLIELDAADTLELFMRDGAPDPQLFRETVGALVRQHAAHGPLRAFGEMVDVLWAAGNASAALQLEELWGRLQETVPFTLLCGYADDHLGGEGRAAVLARHDYSVA